MEIPKKSNFAEGFQLLIKLAEIHVPRMWVECHPERDVQVRSIVEDKNNQFYYCLNKKKLKFIGIENLNCLRTQGLKFFV